MKIVFRILLSLICQTTLAACLQYKAAQEIPSESALEVLEDASETEYADIVDPIDAPIVTPSPEPGELTPIIEIPSADDIYYAGTLEKWYKSDLPRGDLTTQGDISRGIRRVKNQLPINNKVVICSGAGCPIKMPFEFTSDHIEQIKLAMETVIAENTECIRDSASCERRALSEAMVVMEMIVYGELLKDKSLGEVEPYFVGSGNPSIPFDSLSWRQQLDMDCVDQATNGTSYLVVLANNGLVRHHQIIEPGMEHFGFQPHFFTRIADDEGDTFKFDLYHRGRFGLHPYIKLL